MPLVAMPLVTMPVTPATMIDAAELPLLGLVGAFD